MKTNYKAVLHSRTQREGELRGELQEHKPLSHVQYKNKKAIEAYRQRLFEHLFGGANG